VADQGYRASKDVRVVSDKSIEADIVYTVAAQGNRGMQLGFLWCGTTPHMSSPLKLSLSQVRKPT
jgi:hypothetical protein